MYKIPDIEIRRIVSSPRNIRSANSIDLAILRADQKENQIIIEAVVDDRYENECKITYNYNTKRIQRYSCSCPYCDMFSGCGHIYATLRKFNELDDYDFPIEVDYTLSNELNYKSMISKNIIREFQGYYNDSNPIVLPLKDKIHIETNFNDLDEGIIDFKIGTDKLYVIKDIYKFYDDVMTNSFVEFGKGFSAYLNIENFDENSKKIIELIGDSENNRANPRYLHVNVGNLDKLIECYKDNKDFNYNIINEDIRLTLNIDQTAGGYDISINKSFFFILKNPVIVDRRERTIRKCTIIGGKPVYRLINSLSFVPVFILDEDMDDFYRYALSDCFYDIDIEGYEFNNISEEIIKLYGDVYDDDHICFTLLGCDENDENRVYGFGEERPLSNKLRKIEEFIEKYSSEINHDKKMAIMSLSDENTYIFNNEGIKELQNYCEVYISEALRGLNISKKYHITVGVRVNNNLLEIDVNSVDLPKEELSSILKSYKKKKKFYKLKNGKVINLESHDLEELDNFLDEFNINVSELDNEKTTLNLYRALSLNNTINSSENLEYKRAETFGKLIDNFNNGYNELEIKDEYKDILRDYQINGLHWMDNLRKYQFGGILADDMGLGKTLQFIAFLDSLNLNGPSIVITPASLILNWIDEIHKFSKNLKCLGIYGGIEERKNAIENINDYDLVITSYDYIKRDIELYERVNFEYIVLDEAQYIKNQKTKNASSVKMLHGKYKLVLTGTPIENSLAELWSMFDFLMPDYLFNYYYFKNHFETAIVKHNDEKTKNKLKKMVEPFILRRNKKDVLKELPDKIEQTIKIEFSEEEKNLYLANLASVSSELQSKLKDDNFDRIQILAMLTRLRQLCIEPRLIYENVLDISSKMKAALDIIDNYKQNNKKLLLFSSFTGVFDLLIPILEKEKIKYHVLTGATDKIERRRLVNKYQTDDSTVFLISLKAGGTGLNLTSSEGVIHFDPWWNLSAQNQATDRSYRIGQVNNVFVYKLIMKNSIEEKILELQNKKKDLSDSFIEGNEGSISRMSKDEIMDLFKIN